MVSEDLMDYLVKQFANLRKGLNQGLSIKQMSVSKYYAQKKFADTLIKSGKNKSFLEVGCGGSLSIHFLGLSNEDNIAIGCDNDQHALEYSSFLKTHFKSNVNFKKADAFTLPFKNCEFDVVYSIGMIEHYDESEQILLCKEMQRVASKLLIIGIPNYGKFSPAYDVVHNGDEDHKECNLESLARAMQLNNVIFDGRCCFLSKMEVRDNPLYLQFIKTSYPEFYLDYFTADLIDRLAEAEQEMLPELRRKYGFIEFFTAHLN
jgi:SAM-dependent methyltransferase